MSSSVTTWAPGQNFCASSCSGFGSVNVESQFINFLVCIKYKFIKLTQEIHIIYILYAYTWYVCYSKVKLSDLVRMKI